jgi:hypothetical protein
MDDYNNPFSLSYYKKNKIDNKNTHNFNNTETMKPKYSTNEKLMCGVIECNNKTYLVDFLYETTKFSNLSSLHKIN